MGGSPEGPGVGERALVGAPAVKGSTGRNVLSDGPGVERPEVSANDDGSGLAFAGGLPEGV